MVLKDRNSSTSDEDVDSAESAAGAMEAAQAAPGPSLPPPSAAIAIVGATAAPTGESFTSAFSALPQEALQESHTSSLGPPPGFSSPARLPESPLPPPREPSSLLDARLSELNRRRDQLMATLPPMNPDQLDEWVNIQLQRDCILRASYCQTSNDVLLAEVRRLRQMVNEAIRRHSCPSTPVLLFRGALEQILSSLPGVLEHLRSDRPHEELEEAAWPLSGGQAPVDPTNLKGINPYSTLFRESFQPSREGRNRALPPARESRLGQLPIIPGDHVPDGSNGTANGDGDHLEDDFDRLSLSRRRRERRRARSEEFRARNPSPRPLMPGDMISGGQLAAGPVVVVAGGHGAVHRWVSPGLGTDDGSQNAPEGRGVSPRERDFPPEVQGFPPEVQAFPPEQEFPPEVELPTMPLLDSGSFRPLLEESPAASAGAMGFEDRETTQSCPSSPGSSPHLLFHFTDEKELGIRRRTSRHPSRPSSSTTTTTTTTSSSQGDDQPRQRRRRRRERRDSTTESSSMARTESGSTRTTESLRSDDDDTTSRDYETSMTVQEFSEEEEQKR